MKKKITSAVKKGKTKPFPIVAIGASAGGVEAVSELIKNLPHNTGMAFVYIQHLDPTHKSFLTEIIGRITKMKVQDAKNFMRVEPNNVYIIPHDKNLFLKDGVLTLDKRQPKPAINLPIDKFFKSLAEIHKEGSIGVVLSGNANDGTAGLKEIKNAGGLTFAQDSSAKFESMPKAAIAEGCVDMVLSPKEIATEIGRISKNKAILAQVLTLESNEVNGDLNIVLDDQDLMAIIDLLRRSVGVDFQHYKPNTIKRRIIRRLLLYKLKTFGEYLQYLKSHTSEITVLFQDLLINVTAFFRDPDTLEYLKKTLLPKIIKTKASGESIRIWIPACSTGEEAYSLAITVTEILSDRKQNIPIQIFASDLSEVAIAKARIGLYSKSDVADVSPKLLQRFFTKIDGSFRINKVIRDMCVFAPHNIFSDPPFSRLDLVSCCNLMIYLEPVLQKKLLSTFHYSLKTDGLLVLGKSETLGTSSHLFSQIEKKYKVFIKKNDATNKVKFELNYRVADPEGAKTVRHTATPLGQIREASFDQSVEAILLSKYVPASVVVNRDLDILQFHGPVSNFIEISPGKATLNLLKLVRPEIVFDLRSTIHRATKSNQTETKPGLEFKINKNIINLSIEVVPIGNHNDDKTFLIVFEKSAPVTNEDLKKNSFTKDQIVKKLQKELESTKEDMRSILEEQEANNEELQSANEEIVSSNEELQSINEELETAKEEVESSNEELMTINNELQVRNEQLAEAYEYSEAIAETIREAVLILDKDFRVRSANKAFYRIFRTKEEETEGMLIYELGNRQWDILDLRQMLEEIITRRSTVNGFEVNHDFPLIGRKTMLIHARSITQKVHQKQLIILAIEDITAHRAAQKIAEERELWFRNMANNAPCIIWMSGVDKKRKFSSQTWHEFTGVAESEDHHDSWDRMIHPEDMVNYQSQYEKAFKGRSQFTCEYRLKRADGEYRWMLDVAKPHFSDDKFLGYIGTSTEMHDRKIMLHELNRQVKQRTSELKAANLELQRSNIELQQFAYIASHDLQEPLRKILTYIDRLENNDETFSEVGKGYLSKIIESSRRMSKLIDDLLDFSSISLNKKETEKVNLNKIVNEVVNDFELIINEKKADIKYNGTLPTIEGDGMQISQLFHNLIGNALKFSHDNIPPEITISHQILAGKDVKDRERLNANSKYVEVRISDNGIGFDPEFAEQIFIIFQRLNEKKKYPGTGIGLALCKKIINNHKGSIVAESNGEGATFIVTLPIKRPNHIAIE
jgi:two-component system, chemotaxis family, CheB/CheR fusion protein